MRVAAAVSWALLTGPVVALLLLTREAAWTAMLGYHLGCLGATVLVGMRAGVRPASRFLVLLGVASAVLVLIGSFFVNRELAVLRDACQVWRLWGLEPPGDVPMVVYYVSVNPWVEEAFWRGALLHGDVERRIGQRLAWSLAVFGFVPFHAVVLIKSAGAAGALLTLPILLASLFWTFLATRTRGFWASAICHQGANLGLGLVYFLWLRQLSS